MPEVLRFYKKDYKTYSLVNKISLYGYKNFNFYLFLKLYQDL